ncbi:alpha/beta hydrolase [Tahibacter soli]|uniref:Alpha/beta fold hydrolase n=1 Tax=Tahibacter soli TaxID=2983605 RepID=A0A9X3YRY3_9GAMM|nr:alpha/beta hydrolase [Tahibacter soli]MDC8016023.1 alpha/beta fold hydrolase [Tahibacter soli]
MSAITAPKISTTVLKSLMLAWLRVSFAIEGAFAPESAARRGARLFCTPFSSSRSRALAAPLAGATVGEITVDDTRIATYAWGDPATQPYVLFAHGWSSFGTRFAPWVEPLRRAGYAVVAFDQPGHGRSSGARATLPDFTRHLMAVAQHFGPAAALIGHSLGGAASALALARGLDARRVVLIAPAADPIDATRRFARVVGIAEDLRKRFCRVLEEETAISIDSQQVHLNAPFIARPALIVHDLDDADVPWAEGERYARYWPESRLITTTGLGHNRIAHDASTIDAALRFLDGETVGDRVVSSPNLPYGCA